MLASQLDAESSGAGVLSGWYLCHLQMVWVSYTVFLQPQRGSLKSPLILRLPVGLEHMVRALGELLHRFYPKLVWLFWVLQM